MALTPGTRLGPYAITAAIGAGGMGEVYKAHDPRLGRDVAVKVLPGGLSTDPERLARFEQEARAAAALNHPNILAVHDIGQHDGSPYIVSELLEGETLREGLHGGAIPVRKAVEYSVQIAHGLAAAHDKGITHRDLKPENIFVTADGRVKILDFGLAKLTQAEPALAGMSQLPTTPPNTLPGVVLGTIGYMSPEQVRSQRADHRSDIFALGLMLYEMLSGQRAFRGDTAIETMSAILKEHPPDLPIAERHIPPALARIVDRCVQKSPALRFQTATDLAFALEGLSSQSEAAASTPLLPRSKGLFSNARVAWTLVALAGLTIVALSVPAGIHLREQPASSPEVRLEFTVPATREPLHFAISPDGEHLVFVASGDGAQRLWHRPLATVTARPLEGTEGAEYPFWSPDSRTVGFFASSQLKRIDIAGGPPQIVTGAPNGRGGAWNRDGTIVFAPTNASALVRVPASGGEPQPVTTLDPPRQGSHRFPQFLPDGRRFLFFAQGSADGQGIYLGSLDGTATRLTPSEAAGAYAEPGVLVFMQQNTLVVRRLELARSTLTGDLVTVADRVSFDAAYNFAGFSVSAAGRLAYLAGGSERRQLTWFDRAGAKLGETGEPDMNNLLLSAVSPDGRRIAVMRTFQGNQDLWVMDTLRSGATRITFDPAIDGFAAWSPDGARLAFTSNRAGNFDVFLKPPSPTMAEESILTSPLTKLPIDWSRDGRFLLYQHGDPKTGWDLLALPMMGERKPIVLASTPFEERGGQFSPDGQWVAYQSNESGRFEIYVQPFPGPGEKVPVSTAGGTDPRWRADGQELFFLAPDGKLMTAPVRASNSTIDAGTPKALFQTRTVVGGNANLSPQYAVSRDGRFLFNVPDESSPAAPITVILNWKANP